MSILFIRFEIDTLHYIFINNLEELEYDVINIEKIPFNSLEGEGKKYFQILEELKLLVGKNNPNLIVYHSATKYMGKINEIRYANEGFLQYFCFYKKNNLLSINKNSCKKLLGINQKVFLTMLEEKKNQLVSNGYITKSNITLEGLSLLLLIKQKI